MQGVSNWSPMDIRIAATISICKKYKLWEQFEPLTLVEDHNLARVSHQPGLRLLNQGFAGFRPRDSLWPAHCRTTPYDVP